MLTRSALALMDETHVDNSINMAEVLSAQTGRSVHNFQEFSWKDMVTFGGEDVWRIMETILSCYNSGFISLGWQWGHVEYKRDRAITRPDDKIFQENGVALHID